MISLTASISTLDEVFGRDTMAAYSLDLRKRIVDAVERGDASKREIARMFGVHETLTRWQRPSR